MNPIKFKGVNVTYAKDQPQYRPLPCCRLMDEEGTIIICWKLTWRERFAMLFKGKLWQTMLTFNKPLTPQHFATTKPQLSCNDTPTK